MNDLGNWLPEMIGALAVFAIYLGIFFGVLYLTHFLLTLPMRRNERARLFLGLLEVGIKDGRSPETAIAAAARSRDRALGMKFHLLAIYIEQGLKLTQALEKVPRVLPARIVAMLKAGERVGDIGKVLPACRLLLKDAVSHVRGALNYVVLLAFVVTPFSIFVPFILRVKVMPSLKAVFEGMTSGAPLPAITQFVFEEGDLFVLLQLLVLILVWMAMLAYVGGARIKKWVEVLLPGLPDWLVWHLPWHRKRLQRDFSAMLAVLLDSGVPEAEAVTLAGEATANRMFIRRATRVRSLLSEGVKLPEALRALDGTQELQWRLANALRRGSGFLRALTGWHDFLDAKAFQLEQAAAQITTTGLVLLNGAIIGCIVVGLFMALINLINGAVLW
ncbi:MAG TPA: type II secretion system F family protein [Candidatus Dormibacteraeota bacterium]|nr:type II secretion system F family protein [Candidatus Dormibacteraeota bacterium]